MPDVVEQQLATRLRALGETVGDELRPPVDLELQVVRRRRRARASRRWAGVSVAAAVVVAVATVAVVHGTTGRGSVRIATSSTTAVPVRDALQPGTVMLAARGRYVISLDANGHTNATMVAVEHGVVAYARATDDHRALWYLSLKNGPHACGDVVRADIDGRSSTIVTHAMAFDVSPDGTRLALYGAGDLAHDRCTPVTDATPGRVVVLDETSKRSSTVSVRNVTSLRWSPDGSYIVVTSCSDLACEWFKRVDVPNDLGMSLVAPGPELYPAETIHSASAAFGSDGLYVLEATTPIQGGSAVHPTDRIERIDARAFDFAVPIFSGGNQWRVSQVVPTSAGIYVVATPVKPRDTSSKSPSSGLYRVERGRLTFVRSLVDPGYLTPVTPLAASG